MFALNCVTHNLNIEDVEGDGDSAWKRMTGDDFKGKAIPFGSKVFFKPGYEGQDLRSQVRSERDTRHLRRVPPDPGEDPDLADIELSGDEGPGELDGSEPIDAIGDKILDRAGREALDMMPPLPPPATPPPDVSDGRRSLDEVGPSGRLIQRR